MVARADRCQWLQRKMQSSSWQTSGHWCGRHRSKNIDLVRSVMFNFHSVRSITITKLKTKSSQKIETDKQKLDIGSDGNLMPIKMYRMVFLYRSVTDLNKSMKIVLCTYNNSSIQQMGLCRVTIINVGIK